MWNSNRLYRGTVTSESELFPLFANTQTGRKTMTIELGNTFYPHMFSACDLLETAEEYSKTEQVECYNLCSERPNGQVDRNQGELLFIPSIQRAGIARGADAQWTDATSAQDAINRYNNHEMAN